MPVPIVGGVRNQPIFAIDDEIPRAPYPRRYKRRANRHVLELLEAAFPLVQRLSEHRRKPDVDVLELLNLLIEPPGPRLHLNCAELEVTGRTDHMHLEIVALRSKLAKSGFNQLELVRRRVRAYPPEAWRPTGAELALESTRQRRPCL